MYFKDTAIATAQIELEISNREYILSLLDTIKSVVRKFDGKVINKRFTTALNDEIKKVDGYIEYTRLSYTMNSNRFFISIYLPQTSVHIKEDNSEYASSYSIQHKEITLCYLSSDQSYSQISDNGNARLCAVNVVNEIDKTATTLNDYISNIKLGLEKVPEWEKELLELEEKFNTLHKSIPSDIGDYFGLRYYLRSY